MDALLFDVVPFGRPLRVTVARGVLDAKISHWPKVLERKGIDEELIQIALSVADDGDDGELEDEIMDALSGIGWALSPSEIEALRDCANELSVAWHDLLFAERTTYFERMAG